jgi:hypothetical protein
LANNLTLFFYQYGLKKNSLDMSKNEGSNLNVITIALKSIMRCEIFKLNESFQGSCFGHVFPKVCKYLEMYNLALRVCKRKTRMEHV